MPEICRFYGIVIKMYFADHAPPHFHAEYAEYEARIAIDTMAVISGKLPPRAMGLVGVDVASPARTCGRVGKGETVGTVATLGSVTVVPDGRPNMAKRVRNGV